MSDSANRDPPGSADDLFIFSRTDISELTAEYHAFLREVPEIDDARTEEASRMMYQLLTGDFDDE